MAELLLSSETVSIYMLSKKYTKWKYVFLLLLEITTSKNMFTNLVYIFEKTLFLQQTLILSICCHVALPFLKLSRAVNVTGLKR